MIHQHFCWEILLPSLWLLTSSFLHSLPYHTDVCMFSSFSVLWSRWNWRLGLYGHSFQVQVVFPVALPCALPWWLSGPVGSVTPLPVVGWNLSGAEWGKCLLLCLGMLLPDGLVLHMKPPGPADFPVVKVSHEKFVRVLCFGYIVDGLVEGLIVFWCFGWAAVEN